MADDLAFTGLKVLDMAQGVAGPHCGLLLAQHGADVVKLEPLNGDWGRALGKRYGDLSAFGAVYNRGKRSIAVDLKDEAGLAVARQLAEEADVILESFRPGVMARFGLDYTTIAKANPSVVYLSVSGYGQEGPYSKQPVTDSVMQAFSGLMSVNKDDRGVPQRIGVIAIDVFTGLYAFQGVAPALYRRSRTGKGAHLDVSLMQSALAFLSAKMIERHMEGPEPTLLGAPLGTYETADGFLNMNARRDPHFKALMALIGRPELAEDPRYVTADDRVANRVALDEVVRPALKGRTTAEWLKDFEAEDILAGRVNDFPDILEDPHVQAREAVRWLEHDGIGSIPMPLIPGAPIPEGRLAEAPHLGQHTEEILKEIGYDADRIRKMTDAGAALAA
ncbi:MAG: CoA transferase [Alphaproteobacteria bacterium]